MPLHRSNLDAHLRRDFLRTGLFSAGAMAMLNTQLFPSRLLAAPNATPMRFIFMHRGNGLWPRVMVPPSFDERLMEQERQKSAFEVDLLGH